MLTASMLYFVFLVLVTVGGVVLTKIGMSSGHLLASGAGVFGCILASAAATITLSLSTTLGQM